MRLVNKQEKALVSPYHIENFDVMTHSFKLAATTIVVTFLTTMSITLAVPAFPPALLFYEIFNFTSLRLSFWGISTATILNSLTNGLFWALIAVVVFRVARPLKKFERLSSMPIAHPLPTPQIAPQTIGAYTIPISPFFASREAQTPIKGARHTVDGVRMEEESEEDAELEEDVQVEDSIEMIEGMNSTCAELLRNAGIKTIKDLLRMSATEHERHHLAKEVGVTYATLDRWVCCGDLIRLRGIGRKYSALLELIGIKTVTDLSTRNPYNLWQTLGNICLTTNLVVKLPPLKTVETWVQNAKNCSAIEVWVKNSKELERATFDEPELVKYNVCPHCKSTMEEELKTGCQHRFGYLSERDKGEPMPRECVECKKVVECMLDQQYQSATAVTEIKKWY
jgi:predicted flap endonuclease-1-like 5' DNA nuclease